LWNNKREIVNLKQLAKGGPVRAAAVGAFSCIYKFVRDADK
jgi:hypothetical protein